MSKTIYLVKKNPKCNKHDVEWIQMDKRQFAQFIRSGEAKGRDFIHLTDDIDYECDEIFIEASREEYLTWKRQYNAHCYLKGFETDMTILSADAPMDGTDTPLHETLVSNATNIEDVLTNRDMTERVMQAVRELPDKDRALLQLMYFGEDKPTEQVVANALGVSQPAVHKQLKKVFLKIAKKVGY